MEASLVRRSKRIALKRTPDTLDQTAKRVCNAIQEAKISEKENLNTKSNSTYRNITSDIQTSRRILRSENNIEKVGAFLISSFSTSKTPKSSLSETHGKKIESCIPKVKEVKIRTIASTSESPTLIGANVEKSIEKVVSVETVISLRRSNRIASILPVEKPVKSKEGEISNRSEQERSRLMSSSKKATAPKHASSHNGFNMRKNAIVSPIKYHQNEIVMAKMTGHMIWPAKVTSIISIFFYFDHFD